MHYDGSIADEGQVVGYSDADWGNDLDSRRSKTGYAIFMNGGCNSWRSKLQPCVSLSTLEAEMVACNETGRELIWARGVAKELGYVQRKTINRVSRLLEIQLSMVVSNTWLSNFIGLEWKLRKKPWK